MPIDKSLLLLLATMCIGLIIGGSILQVNSRKKVSSLQEIEPTNFFTLESKSCTIVDSSITSITKRTSTRDGGSNGSVRTEDFCEDAVYYTFVWNGSPNVNVTSRTLVTIRNVRQISFAIGTKPRDELCIATSENGLMPYEGVLKEDTPFVCAGGLCELGTVVDCWRPKDDVCGGDGGDESCSDNIDWANCGNSQCLKLVDPSFELAMAILDAGFPIGIMLIVFGIIFGIFGSVVSMCFCKGDKKEVY
mmetsp:Transcript_14867/g.27951  ORF Transcript_14867/g.27951 Transcript_14867/m.27951 type:complete len:248 (-) Transcript_14867:369-1112(-)